MGENGEDECLIEKENGGENGGANKSSLWAHQILAPPIQRENRGEERGLTVITILPPHSFLHSLTLVFSFLFSFYFLLFLPL